jgi:RimJ/RimL family protein N-acetyltransferase
VLAAEHGRLRELRLAALAADPEAFGATHAGEAARPDAWWQAWAAASEAGREQRTFVLVAEDDPWLGLALVRLDPARPASAVVNAMWVAPGARGRGGSRLLCDACAAWAAARGCDELTLGVVAGNHAARRAYEAAGFAVRGRISRSLGSRTLEELVMRRAL